MAQPDLRIPGYEKVRLIKRCGQAEVWEVVRQSLNQHRALKLLRPELSDSANAVARLRREAQIAAALHHPNIVRVWDLDSVDGRFYIIMDLVDGPSLDDVLAREGRLSPERCRRLVADLGPALDYAHAQGVIHRDVKPGNILFARDGSARLTDFGIARAADSQGLTIMGTLLGTPPYMSPEQCSGAAVGAPSDLFSLASVLFEAITGQRPFERGNDNATMYAIVNQDPPLHLVPAECRGFFRRALQKSPAARFQSGAQMAEAFAAAVRPVVVSPQPKVRRQRPPKPPRPQKPRKTPRTPVLRQPRMSAVSRRRVLVGGLAATVLGLGVVAGSATGLIPPIESWISWINNDGGGGGGGGAKQMTIPKVSGKTLDEAKSRLKQVGLTAGDVTREPGTGAAGTVTRTEPKEGNTVEKGSEVTLFVVEGKPAQMVMPKLRGKNWEEADRMLERMGLSPPSHKEAFDADLKPGEVTKSFPAKGKPISRASKISLYVNSMRATRWLNEALSASKGRNWERVVRLSRCAEILDSNDRVSNYNIGYAAMKLGRGRLAVHYLKLYVEHGEKKDLRKDADRWLDDLRRQGFRSDIGWQQQLDSLM